MEEGKISPQINVVGFRYDFIDPEAYLELSQTSTMELFCKISQRLLTVNYFRKKAPS